MADKERKAKLRFPAGAIIIKDGKVKSQKGELQENSEKLDVWSSNMFRYRIELPETNVEAHIVEKGLGLSLETFGQLPAFRRGVMPEQDELVDKMFEKGFVHIQKNTAGETIFPSNVLYMIEEARFAKFVEDKGKGFTPTLISCIKFTLDKLDELMKDEKFRSFIEYDENFFK